MNEMGEKCLEKPNTAIPHAGFRLYRLEVFNWGTFGENIWGLDLRGENTLLTGDIGSGKSTLVDALTTLLVPSRKISFNKAAGAETRERDLRSYVLGYYKTERGEAGLSAKPVPLRDHNNYSVILARFRNEGFEQDVTLAQVFWIKDGQGQPERFHVIADDHLAIREHFANFGSDILSLKKRLRGLPGIEVHETFPPYAAAFRRRFGIKNNQALELFLQTVSMKTVGNLTDFVRQHMLESFPVEDRIKALITHFDDLNRAHEAVLKAKRQVEQLTPLVAYCDRHAELSEQVTELRDCRDALEPWFAGLKGELLEKRLSKLKDELEKLDDRIESLSKEERDLISERDNLNKAINANGGDRLERIATDITNKEQDKGERKNRAENYRERANDLGLPDATDVDVFFANRRAITTQRAAGDERRDEIQNALTEATVEFRRMNDQHNEISEEITSLRRRRSNIPRRMLELRGSLCQAIGVAEEALPFAGELIQVRKEERDWEGAAERLLHNFGLSLLVPDKHYADVAEWVDRTHLGARLVYFRVREHGAPVQVSFPAPSLVRKLAIKSDSDCYNWLEKELARRFDYACCDTLDQFRREKKAITRTGQFKGGGGRHEKDDRHHINDRSRYVLGWSNADKIAALEKEVGSLKHRLQNAGDVIASKEKDLKDLSERLQTLSGLEVFGNFREIDWRPLAVEIERLQKEKTEIEKGSDVLRTLQSQLETLEQALSKKNKMRTKAGEDRAVAASKQDDASALLKETRSILDATQEKIQLRYFPRLEEMRAKVLSEHTLTVESCDNREKTMREWLQKQIDGDDRKIAGLVEKIVRVMQSFCDDWPTDTHEMDANVAAAGEYRALLNRLHNDDLPRFEADFKKLLNENTIREIANFQSQLHRERQTIGERIESINHSLREIDYNPGRYIALEADMAMDTEVRDFQQDLRTCTEGALTGSEDEEYSEAKFNQVKRIIERFRGREGTTDVDEKWTRKVTDVRNWYLFSASERWREDDTEHEHYADSGGKSGGQKEKLAYTVLAASLAYQFGLDQDTGPSRTFRFVAIDEAFGRASDESTRYGLELFQRMDLQLLFVTPMQKVHVIEPFIASVGYVYNPDGNRSLLRNLTIEEYKAEQKARKQS